MPHDLALDPYDILKTLGVHAVHAVVPVTGGTDTALWRVEHDQLTSALRVFRSTQVTTYLHERYAMDLAAQHNIPVPRIRAHGYWHDRPALLLGWCAGQPLAATLQHQPWRLFRLGRAFGQMQAHIHQIHLPRSPNSPLADWIKWYHPVDADLEAQLVQHTGHVHSLLHLDYHPLNVMTHTGGVSGVLDWANVRAGDPRADVARTYTILVVEPHRAGREPFWYTVARRLLARTWLSGYQAIAGTLRDMPLFFAWAGAVMGADLAPRVANPNSWWQPHHLEHVHRWTRQWRKEIKKDGV